MNLFWIKLKPGKTDKHTACQAPPPIHHHVQGTDTLAPIAMPRPLTITNDDLARWNVVLDKDPFLQNQTLSPIIIEVCYAGLWLAEELQKLHCPEDIIGKIIYTAGGLCFGQKDPWLIHDNILQSYINNTLQFDIDTVSLN